MKTTIVIIIAIVAMISALFASCFSDDHRWGFMGIAWAGFSVIFVLCVWNVIRGMRMLDDDEHY